MLNLIRGLSVAVLGVGVMVGPAYGVLAKSSREGHRIIDVSEPILTCDDGTYDKYEIFLALADKGEQSLGEEVTFRIQKTSKGNLESKRVPWGENAKGGLAWSNWKLSFEDYKLDGVWTKSVGQISTWQGTDMLHGCDKSKTGISKIEVVKGISNDNKYEIEAGNIKFEINSCLQKDGFKECDIKFVSSTNLKWVDGFTPKMRFVISG